MNAFGLVLLLGSKRPSFTSCPNDCDCGPVGPWPAILSFNPEKEHQDIPWFWFSFLPLPVTSPARTDVAVTVRTMLATEKASPMRLFIPCAMRAYLQAFEVGLAIGSAPVTATVRRTACCGAPRCSSHLVRRTRSSRERVRGAS